MVCFILAFTMSAYYNEIDDYAADWLENLIRHGHIADGVVDRRSIVDVEPSDVSGFTQCHFFAGIGGWSRALRLAGWPDGRPVWTGSPPCQPFSVAGKRLGHDDPRHLAPHWLELVAACRPQYLFGEQVAAAIRHGWLDDLQDALEREGYATGAAVLPACGVGAPHIRQRLWFVAERLADTSGQGSQGREISRDSADQLTAGQGSLAGGLAYTEGERLGETREAVTKQFGQEMALQHYGSGGKAIGQRETNVGRGSGSSGRLADPGPTNGYWRTVDWIGCRDGKWRPVEPGTFPLVDGVPNRVGRLRAYGNAIVPQVAAEVIQAAMF